MRLASIVNKTNGELQVKTNNFVVEGTKANTIIGKYKTTQKRTSLDEETIVKVRGVT